MVFQQLLVATGTICKELISLMGERGWFLTSLGRYRRMRICLYGFLHLLRL